jgi:hypothetical protein
MDSFSPAVTTWWVTISAISVINIVAFIAVAVGLERRRPLLDPAEYDERRLQLVLSAVFVFGCAFRSFLPLVTQWTLVLRRCARSAGAKLPLVLSWFLIPLIASAEWHSWYTTLTTNFIGSVIEESTWALTGTLVVVSFAWLLPRQPRGPERRFVAAAILLNAAYVFFMVTVDVPMYWARYTAGQASGRHYLSLSEGWRDSQERRVVTHRWQDWRNEVPWMSLYFSVGVWISLSLVRAPRFERPPEGEVT